MKTSVSISRRTGLDLFVERIVADPDRLRRRWLGETALRRNELTPLGRRLLGAMGPSPTLLGPLSRSQSEVLHTKMLVWAMTEPEFANEATERFLGLLETSAPHAGAAAPAMGDAAELVVQAERPLPGFGRVDLWLQGAGVAAVEVKVAAEETGGNQVDRYVKGCAAHVKNRPWVVLFLTLDGNVEPSGPCLHATFGQLLAAWLPIAAAGSTPAHHYLALYLSTVAELAEIGGSGPYDTWTVAERRSGLTLVETIPGALPGKEAR